ncbi:hypothetical protein SmJEL517_g06141 [Synchytrium microbalum]|uniref:Ribonuclease P/MRP protein subunit POP5 n=1 Tax=Synchytrium microbalum TaxID=1806994 RepID=A0A507BR56_9FUNG|nr:uncharacterized protein SmJEL517_g06141 [Synchytrium microbalum]TPX30262.1 hypothetical protein SmJEL517_g06141 [Synchytrium microbalum]
MRFKNRYLLFELQYEDGTIDESVHNGIIISVLRDSIQLNFGDYGIGVLGGPTTSNASTSILSLLSFTNPFIQPPSYPVKYFSPHTGLGILRVPRDHYQMAWAAMSFVTQVKKKNAMMRVIHLGGTIKSCQTQAIEYDKAKLRALKRRKVINGNAPSF